MSEGVKGEIAPTRGSTGQFAFTSENSCVGEVVTASSHGKYLIITRKE